MAEFGPTFGAETGWQEGSQFAQQSLLRTLTAQQKGEELQQAKQINPLIVREQQAKVQQMEQKAAQEKRFAEIMSGKSLAGLASGDNPESGAMSNFFGDIIGARAEAGQFDVVQKLMPKYDEMQQKEAQTRKANAQKDNALLDGWTKRLEHFGQLLNPVKDQASWDDAVMRYNDWARGSGQPDLMVFDNKTRQKIPAEGSAYEPERVEAMKATLMKGKDYVESQRKALDDKRKNLDSESLRKHREAEEKIWEEKLKVAKAAEARREKAGGKVKDPNDIGIEFASSMIKQDFPDLSKDANQPKLNTVATEIASRARAIQHENPAINMTTATRQAFDEAKKAGTFVAMTKPGILGTSIGEKKETRFEPRGMKSSEPIVIKKGEEPTDGRWYTKGGVSRQWKDGKWGPPVSNAQMKAAPEEPEDGDEDEDEEED